MRSLRIASPPASAGLYPFGNEKLNNMRIAMQILNQPFKKLTDVASGATTKVADVVHKALAKDPKDRWQTAQEMLDALREAGDVGTNGVGTNSNHAAPCFRHGPYFHPASVHKLLFRHPL